MASEIKNFLFGKDEILLVSLSDNTNRSIYIHGNYDECDLKLIHDINRRHMVTVFEGIGDTDGCLPSKCMGVEDPSVNISPRYLIHCFINIMELLFKTDENAALFVRDKDIIELPTSNDNLEKIMTDMTSIQNTTTTNPLDVEMEGDNDVNFNIFLRILIQKMFGMQKHLKDMVSKNTSKLNRTSSVIGGINLKKNNGEEEGGDILTTGLRECSEVIHSVIRKNAEVIIRTALDPNNVSMVAMKKMVEICSEERQQPLYANLNISFSLMYECIGEVFNVLLVNIIPRTSMMEAMQGSFYNAAVLSELKLQGRFPDILCIPILYRFIHSCFKDESSQSPSYLEDAENYLKQNYTGMFTQIEKLQKGYSNPDEILCTIALKSNFQDKTYLEALYWVLNIKRSCTFEYYIVLMTVLYIAARCSNVNANSKRCNALSFITPIYSIMKLFYKYVTALGLPKSLCSSTMENFSTMYQKELKENLQIVVKSII